MVRIVRRQMIVWGCLWLAGCGGTAPTTPGAVLPFAGTWSGTVADDSGAVGTVTLRLDQVGAGVSGTFTIVSTTPGLASQGNAGGTAQGATVGLFLTPASPLTCSPTLTLTGTISSNLTIANDRLTGRYFGTTCTGGRSGSLDLSR